MHFSITILIIVLSLLIPLAFFFFYKPPAGPNRFGEIASPVGLVDAVKNFFSRYFDFKGRSSRSEFWYSILFFIAVSFLMGFFYAPDILFSLWSLATIVPLVSVAARRLHDTNRSGWFQLVSGLTPIGTIIAVVWFSEPPSENRQSRIAEGAAPPV